MNKIVEGTYTYYVESPQEEIDLTATLLNNVDLSNKEELFKVIPKILELPFNEQVHVIHCIVDTLYSLNEGDLTNGIEAVEKFRKNESLERVLSQDVFKIHRDVIYTCVDTYDKPDDIIYEIASLEKRLNIKIKTE